MPRGYLKKSLYVGRKQARGGSSRRDSPHYNYRSSRLRNKQALIDDWDEYDHDYDDSDYEESIEDERLVPEEASVQPHATTSLSSTSFSILPDPKQHVIPIDDDGVLSLSDSLSSDSFVVVAEDEDVLSLCTIPEGASEITISKDAEPKKCVLCHQVVPLTEPVMKRCKSHGQACRDCLYARYVVDESNCGFAHFPLRCFDPGCSGILRDTQIKKLVKSTADLDSFYAKEVSSRRLRRSFAKSILDFELICQGCQARKTICYHESKDDFIAFCTSKNCRRLTIVHRRENVCVDITRSLFLFGEAVDEIARCPLSWCGKYISKQEGCDAVECVCGNEFRYSYNLVMESREGGSDDTDQWLLSANGYVRLPWLPVLKDRP